MVRPQRRVLDPCRVQPRVSDDLRALQVSDEVARHSGGHSDVDLRGWLLLSLLVGGDGRWHSARCPRVTIEVRRSGCSRNRVITEADEVCLGGHREREEHSAQHMLWAGGSVAQQPACPGACGEVRFRRATPHSRAPPRPRTLRTVARPRNEMRRGSRPRRRRREPACTRTQYNAIQYNYDTLTIQSQSQFIKDDTHFAKKRTQYEHAG